MVICLNKPYYIEVYDIELILVLWHDDQRPYLSEGSVSMACL